MARTWEGLVFSAQRVGHTLGSHHCQSCVRLLCRLVRHGSQQKSPKSSCSNGPKKDRDLPQDTQPTGGREWSWIRASASCPYGMMRKPRSGQSQQPPPSHCLCVPHLPQHPAVSLGWGNLLRWGRCVLWQPALSGLPRLRLGGCLGREFHVSGEDRTWVAPFQFPALHRHLGQGSAWHWRLGSAWNCSERSLEVEAEDYKRFDLGFFNGTPFW